jgi:hypothetical protein
MKKILGIIVLGLFLSGNAFAEVKFQKTKLKIDDLVLQGYTLFAAQLEGNNVGNGVYILTKDSMDTDQSIFHCYVAMKGLPRKVETCYNLTPSVDWELH